LFEKPRGELAMAATKTAERPELMSITSRLERKLTRRARKQAAKADPSQGSKNLAVQH
jgi:hypothetical protein